MSTYRVGYFVGSLSSNSINRILSKALIRLAPQDLEHARVLVTHIEIDALCFDGVSSDQRAFERAVRVALEEPAVLERAGLALVAIDRHQARAFV